MKIDGSCHCGKITLTAEVDPSTLNSCHCTDCQIISGGPCRTGVAAKAENISINGVVAEYTKVAESGRNTWISNRNSRNMWHQDIHGFIHRRFVSQ